MGKTGEWMVTDKTILTPGPRLPERQHAGWQVSKKTETETEEVGSPKGGEKSELIDKETDKKKKKKHKKEKKKKKKKEKSKKKYDKLSESDEEEQEKQEKKNKQKKDKHEAVDEQNQGSGSGDKSKSKKQKRKKADDNDDDDTVNPSKKPCLVSYADSSSCSSDEHVAICREAGKSAKFDSQDSAAESRGVYVD